MFKNKDKNKIAFVLGGMGNGGAERVVSILANHYAKKGKSVDIITLLSSNCTYQLEPNVRLISLANEGKSRKLQTIDWIKGIKKYNKVNRPYCVISFFAKINIIVLLALYNRIGDIVVSERNDPSKDGRGPFVKLLTNILYPKTKKVVFQTKWAQSCFRSSVVKNSKIVYNPVTEISIPNVEKTKTIVNVGKLMDQKNQKLLISAFSKVVDNYPEYKLVIYGDGTKRQELEELIESLGLNDRVMLPGWTSEIYEKVAAAELFVLSSDYEGFSNALLEAMMIGAPVISTNCAGSNEIIKNNVNGLLVPVDDLDKLVLGIRKMLGNPELANRMAQHGKRDVGRFGVSKIIGCWEEIIE
jgi:GalNAc-alpha-(1->4)-GalNAc-alpha-(1->3)-diNAcBac-PP-undecaprenol alpha-1,4-N-acetyl-D-galactosaminyltransferase